MTYKRVSLDRTLYNLLSPKHTIQYETLLHLMLTQPRYMQSGSRHKMIYHDI